MIFLLSTTIKCPAQNSIQGVSSPFIRKSTESRQLIYLKQEDKVIGEINYQANSIVINYSSELFLEEYIIIREIIIQLQQKNSGLIDDSKSFLGYLPDGDPAYIITNWDRWIDFLQRSMKNCQ